MATVVKNLFRSRAESYFDCSISSTDVLPNIFKALRIDGLFDYFKLWFETSVFLVYSWWKTTVRRKVRENQNEVWSDFCLKHPDLKQAYEYLNNVPPNHFWSLANHYPDLVSRLHVQVRIIGNFGLNGGIPWLTKAPVKRSQLFIQQRTTFVVKKKFVSLDHLVVCCCIMLYVVVSCCMKFARDQKCLYNECCAIEHFFCFQ